LQVATSGHQGYQLGVARGLCCAAVGLGLVCFLISDRMGTSGTADEYPIRPKLRVFSFVTRWSYSGTGLGLNGYEFGYFG
jgi:hypothetical protein